MENIRNLETGMLAFERSLQASEALLYSSASGNDKAPLPVVEKGVRGQTSNDFSTAKKRDSEAGNSNIQTVEAAFIPPGHDQLIIDFSLRVMPGSQTPHACNDPVVTRSYEALSEHYGEIGGYKVLASAFVWNILNGRFAWRNAFQTDEASVTVRWGKAQDSQITIRVLDEIGRHEPKSIREISEIKNISDLSSSELASRLEDLVTRFAESLEGASEVPLTINVSWTGNMLQGQEVFPSQEYLADTSSGLSREYAKINNRGIKQASIHSQKITAALKHIDYWHDKVGEYGAVAINPYAAVQSTGEVLRLKDNFYTKRSDVKKLLDPANINDLHFVMANLVRGGVLGKSNEKKATKEDAKEAKATKNNKSTEPVVTDLNDISDVVVEG